MMSDLGEKIKKIKADVETLSQRYGASLVSISKLKEEKEQLESALKEKQETITNLEEELKLLKIARNVSDGDAEKNTELKRKINQYIREIDKCIALLNT